MRERRKANGITIVALAITIVVLLILAGITISIVFSQDGVIKKAQEAKEQTEVAQIREQLELAKATEFIEGNGKIDPDSYFQRLEDEGIIGDKDTDVVETGDGVYEVTTDPGYIFEVTVEPSKDNPENIDIEYVGKTDGPRIRDINVTKGENSVTVEVETVNAEGATYTYSYKKDGDADWTDASTSDQNTYTFEGLENTEYSIKVKVEKDGKSAEKEISVSLRGIPGGDTALEDGSITIGEPTWSEGKASITVNTNTQYQIEYQINGTTDGSWTNIGTSGIIPNLNVGDKVNIRLTNGTNHGEYVTKTIEDKAAPTVNVTSSGNTSNSIAVNVQATDNESGMANSLTYTYYIKQSGQDDSSYASPNGATDIAANTYTFTDLTQGTSYDVKVEVKSDIAGNAGTGTLLNQTTGSIPGGETGVVEGAITFGSTTWRDNKASITISTNTSYNIEYQVNGIDEGSWKAGSTVTDLSYGDTVYARLTDGTNAGDYASVSVEDKLPPTVTVTPGTITTNSIAVSAQATDSESGMASSLTYTYYIKQSSQDDSSYASPSGATDIAEDAYTFTGLQQGTSYDIKVEVKSDMAGNTGTGTLLNQTTTSIPGGSSSLDDGTITIGDPEWSDGKASITVSTNTEYTIEYQVNGTTDENWTNIGNNGTIPDLSYGDTVNVRLTDGTNAGEYVSTTIGDEIAPTVNVTLKESTSDSIAVNVEATDNESGMANSLTYTYYIKQSSQDDNSYTTPDDASNITTNTYTFTGLTQNVSYDVKVEVKSDVAGNTGTGTLLKQTTGSIPGGDTALTDGSISISEPTWSEGKASVTVGTNTSYSIEYQINGSEDGKWTSIENNGSIPNLNAGDTVNVRLTDGTNAGGYVSKTIEDKVPPTVTVTSSGNTSSSVAVSVQATDAESGMASSLTYTYYIKQSTEADSNYVAKATEIAENTYTFTGLTQGTSYDVKVEVTGDVTGNTGTGTLLNQTTGSIPGGDTALEDGSITINEPTWSAGKASATVGTNTEYSIEYQINGTEEGKWISIENNGTIPNLNDGDMVNVRLTDGTNAGGYVSKTIEDTTAPTVNVTLASNGITSNSIAVNAQATDNESGMASSLTCTYYIKKSSEEDTAYVAKATDVAQNTYTFTGLQQGTSYDVKVEVKSDIAGNTGTGTLLNQTTTSIPGGSGSLDDGSITVSDPTWSNGTASIDISTDTEYSIEYQINGTTEGNWTNIGNNGIVPDLGYGDTVNIRLTDGTNKGDFVTVTIGDEIAPTVNVTLDTSTSDSIAVNVQATDNESGMASSPTYTYYIKESTDPDSSYASPSGATEIAQNTYTFTGLTQGTSYDVKVEVKSDMAGNMGTGTLLNQITSSIPGGDSALTDGTITIGEPTWSAGKASITVSTNTQYQIEYQVNGTTEESWIAVTGETITGLSNGDTVNIRLTDGTNAGGYVSKIIEDTTAPTVNVTLASNGNTSNSIAVNVQASDNESGMVASPTYTYYIKKTGQGDENYQAPSVATGIAQNTYTFTGLTQGTSYDIKVEVTGDVAGNTGTGTLLNQTTQSIPGGEQGVEEGAITFGDASWSSGTASITISTNTNYQIEYQINGTAEESWTTIENNGSISGLSSGDTVYARLTDNTNVGNYASVDITDEIAPTVTVTLASNGITSNSITVNVQASDNESGMVTSPTYTYYIKKSSEEDTAYVAKASNIAENTYTFTGLTQGTSYDVKVEVTGDVAGNTGIGTLLNQITASIPDASGPDVEEGAITFRDTSWSSNKASITVSTNTNYQIEYQVGGIEEGKWTGIANNGTISNLNYGDTVYARLTDGVNHGDYASASIDDKNLPQNATIDLSGTSTNTAGSITATVTLADNESGVNATGSKWAYNTTATEIGTEESSYTNTFNSNGETITLQATTAGTYYLHVLTVDNAGNKKETISDAVTVVQLATGVTVSPTSVTLTEGETQQLTATVSPDTTDNKAVKWESNSPGVATVSTNGLVTAKTEGTATIIVASQDGSNKTATCSVTVKMKPTPIADILKAGDCVNYVDGTGKTRKCVVLYDSSSPYGVEIITMETVEDVTLGDDDNFKTSMNSYNNAISTLNNATSKYINTTYVDKARSVGSVPNNPNSQSGYYTFTKFSSSYSGKLRDTDTNYETDYNQMKALNINNIDDYYWLASRNVNSSSNYSYFSMRYVDAYGSLRYTSLCNVNSRGNTYSFSYAYGLRPVFHLRSNIKVTGGTGEEGDPYTLGT